MSGGHLLVGIDGSPAADAALAWAAAEARLRDVGLVLITAYRFPLAFAGTGADPALAAPDEQQDHYCVGRARCPVVTVPVPV